MEDWENNVSDEEVWCPMCGHIAPSDQWFTNEQIESMQNIAASYVESYMTNELDKTFKKMAQNTRGYKNISLEYKSNKKVSFTNNPIGQRSDWELEITCEKCLTKYSVIGSAFFCPCCGHNAVEHVFYESLDTVHKMLESIDDLFRTFEESYSSDKAETMCRSMIEGTLGDIVSAFQKYVEELFRSIARDKKVRVNDFQIIEKGSELFRAATQKGYDTWLSKDELEEINRLFQQRHIIEHNNGMIDEKYIQKSGDTSYKIGQRVIVRREHAERLLLLVRMLSSGLKELSNI